jgi:hypothetical protein
LVKENGRRGPGIGAAAAFSFLAANKRGRNAGDQRSITPFPDLYGNTAPNARIIQALGSKYSPTKIG